MHESSSRWTFQKRSVVSRIISPMVPRESVDAWTSAVRSRSVALGTVASLDRRKRVPWLPMLTVLSMRVVVIPLMSSKTPSLLLA